MSRLFAAFGAALAFAALPLPAAVTLPDVCATVDGEPITRADLMKAFDAVILASGKLPSSLGDEERLQGYKVVVDGLINDRLIARAAKDIVVPESEVNARFREIKDKHDRSAEGAQGTFLESLAKTGMTESGLRENLAASIRQGRWMAERIEPLLIVTEPEIRKAYEANKETFTNPAVVRASHILFKIDSDATAADVAAKKKAADDVTAKLVASKGADFAKLAAQYSEDDGTKAKGGDLGWFAGGSAEAALEKTIFGMKVGDISAAVRSKLGFHILQKTGQRPAEAIPLEKVKDRIRELLLTQKRKAALEKLMADMRAKAKIDIKLPNN